MKDWKGKPRYQLWVEEIFKSKDARLNISEEEYIENALATLLELSIIFIIIKW